MIIVHPRTKYSIKNSIEIINNVINVDIKNKNFLVLISIDSIIKEPQKNILTILNRGSSIFLIKNLCIKNAIAINIIVSAIINLVIFINI